MQSFHVIQRREMMNLEPLLTNFRIQTVSDLHLENDMEIPKIEPHAPYLALVGDIGMLIDGIVTRYTAFLVEMGTNYLEMLINIMKQRSFKRY